MEDRNLWIKIQQRTFTRWCNTFLIDRMMKIENLETDLCDGIKLINLLEIISAQSMGRYNKKPRIRAMQLENTGLALRFLKQQNIKLVAIGPEDITDGNIKLILGMIWTIILRYQIQRGEEGAGSAKSELLKWVQQQIPQYNIKNFKDNWCDGKAICALAESVKPGCFPGSQHNPDWEGFAGNPMQDCARGFDVSEREMDIPQVLDAEDMVYNPDELSNMTYISYFRDYLENKANRDAAEAFERTPVAGKCRAYGPGLESAEVGIPADFTIEAVNGAGRRITVGGHPFVVDVDGPDGAVPVELTDNGDGSFSGTYTPTVPGNHTVAVKLDQENLPKSPFTVPVVPSKPDASQCEAYGPGLEGGAANTPARFKVQAKNRLGDPVTNGGAPFKVSVDGPYGEVPSEVTDNGDGTYDVVYHPADEGDHEVNVVLKGEPIKDMPRHVNIGKDPYAADASKTWCEGPGLEDGANAHEPANFKIHAADSDGNALDHGGDMFDCEVTDPEGNVIPSTLKDNGDGTYDVEYQPDPEKPGDYNVDVMLRNKADPTYFDHVNGFPKTVTVEAGADPSHTIAYGPGLEDGILDTQPTHFTIESRDAKGNRLPDGGEDFDVVITGPDGEVRPEVVDNGDGLYTVNYSPLGAGKHRIDVGLRDKPISDSPYHVNVASGADPSNSFVDGYSFTIRTVSRLGKNLSQGGESGNISVTIDGPSSASSGVAVGDNGDGSYTVSYRLPEGGQHTIGVLINGEHIKGSPWTQG